MNHTFYRYRLETADLYNPDTREVSVVFLGESGGRLRISVPADDARRLINSWGPLLLKDMQRDSADPGAAPHSWGPLPLKVQQRFDHEPEARANATATIPGTDGQPDREVPARVHISRTFVRDDAKASPAGTSAFAGPSTKAAHLNFTDDNGGKFTLAMEMQCFRKLRSAMLAVDEDGNAIDPAKSDDDSEIDAVVSALAALTDRVRALEERGAKPIDPEQVLDALRSKATRSFKEPRT